VAEGTAQVQLFGSGSILNEALRAQKILAEKYQVAADCLVGDQLQPVAPRSAGSGALESAAPGGGIEGAAHRKGARRFQRSHRGGLDYIKAVPDQLAPWLCGRLHSLGTDGFGRSENREYLRRFFEISAEAIAQTALSSLARSGAIDARRAELAIAELGFHPEQRDPAHA